MQSQQRQQQLAIFRVTHSTDGKILQQPYFKIRPKQNEILAILEDLDSHRLNAQDVESRVRQSRLLQFPQIMKNLQLIIEYSDCIVQGNDLLNFEIVIDEDKGREQRTALAQLEKKFGFSEGARIEGRQVCPTKVAQPDGIIRENIR